jgi:nucleoid-associated protein YgaU
MSQPSRIMLTLRFIVGVSMVAGGAALAAPFLLTVAAAVGRQEAVPLPVGGMGQHLYASGPAGWAGPQATAQDVGNADHVGAGLAASPAVFPSPASVVSIPVGNEPAAWTAPEADVAAQMPAGDPFVPPAPPQPLPRMPLELMGAGPEFTGTYRSTLDLPPPPLLDGPEPPPGQVAWTAQPATAPRQPDVHTIPAALVPPTYIVRDGDDLTSIAARFYGHPAAAGAIWTANRRVLSDPEVLPIGGELTLPPPWTIALVRPGGGTGPTPIEPRPASAAAPRTPATVAPVSGIVPVSWLGEAQRDGAGLTAAQPATLAPAAATPARPTSVRIAPGETLESLAVRFYGDRAMAGRIWDVNRDRLRSPALVVPGMELRLP